MGVQALRSISVRRFVVQIMTQEPTSSLETKLSKIPNATIVRWHLPKILDGEDILITLHNGIEIRVSYVKIVQVHGGATMSLSEFVENHAAWFKEPYWSGMDNNIGTVANLHFDPYNGGIPEHNHFDGQGSITLHVTLEGKVTELVIASLYIKLM